MDSRRDFLKKAGLLAVGGGLAGVFPESIQRAFAIDPAPGTTYLDAEHIVVLMQENRSFDHCFGTLNGVRGFNDPRAIVLPDGNPVWLQSNAQGETYVPFRLNIKDTSATWTGYLPHSWSDQSDARNGGKHDQWLNVKIPAQKACAHIPLSLGYYNRDDLPFYYALADAFTICDQAFCSSLTGTTPNRLYLWTGTIRAEASSKAKANVRNEDVNYGNEVSWKTFPERLETAGISWRVYQNEISLPTGLSDEGNALLGNFICNPLEWFRQYHSRYSLAHRSYLLKVADLLPVELGALKAKPLPHSPELEKQIAAQTEKLRQVRNELAAWPEDGFAKLSAYEQSLHRNAFSTNQGDPHYHEITTVEYSEGGVQKKMPVPKGDIFHQFRKDALSGELPAISWLVAPSNYSDHPNAPWLGAWYVSETLDILTQNPEVWKKTIFILCYDENDGYFDHVPPFVAPHPDHPETGKASAGVDTLVEQVGMEQEDEYEKRFPKTPKRAGPIGLGFRVPLLIASPWSRGGYVCSQVFDHTSVLQLMEKWLSKKTGTLIREANISTWRRAVCGDLSSAFRPYHSEAIPLPTSLNRNAHTEQIYRAMHKPLQAGFKKLSAEEVKLARTTPHEAGWLARQETGSRPSCALPYELEVNGVLSEDREAFILEFAASNRIFKERAAGAPFRVYAPGSFMISDHPETGHSWDYTVVAGDRISENYKLANFQDGNYHVRVHGPNGFFREFNGGANDPLLEVSLRADQSVLKLVNRDKTNPLTILFEPLAYVGKSATVIVKPDSKSDIPLDLERSHGWYDFRIRAQGIATWEQRFAGRFETGQESVTDPLLDFV